MTQHQPTQPLFLNGWWRELIGAFLILFALMCLLAAAGLTASAPLNRIVQATGAWVGRGNFAYFALLGATGIWLLLHRVTGRQPVPRFLGAFAILVLLALPILNLFSTNVTYFDATAGKAGGLVGWVLAGLLTVWWGWLLVVGLYLIAGMLMWSLLVGRNAQQVVRWLINVAGTLRRWGEQVMIEQPSDKREHTPQIDTWSAVDGTAAQAREAAVLRPKTISHKLPPLRLLDINNTKDDSHAADVGRSKAIIEQTLVDFGLVGEVTDVRAGPTITQFGVTPGYIERSDGTHKKVRIAQIATLRPDFALALAVPRLRIEAPVPGRGIVGIELPNKTKSLVRLREVIESAAFKKVDKRLTVALGQDVSGAAVAIDLAKMPHLLIAGTTGSGKSVCMKALITALVANNTPEQLRLVMIDPKRVEMIRFNGLPHLYGAAEVEGERIIGVLRWLVAEMDRRYAIFAQVNARQLTSYNTKMRTEGSPIIPHLVVFIDELADLMAQFSAETERTLCRLAQMARATGIHLVVATQRPSTDVITGLIKANFPARIAFSVTSSIDSRVVLDTTGAEQLLGNGDMLFLGSDASMPRRVQGCFVSDEEIDRIVSWWEEDRRDDEQFPPPWNDLLAKMKVIEETDDELERAIALCQKYDNISTSLIQRRLRVGFPRAARIMENLYEMGLVEDPKRGGKTRKTHVSESDGDVFGRIADEHGRDDTSS